MASAPLTVTRVVKTITSGSFTVEGWPDARASGVHAITVVLDTGKVQIVLLSRHIEPTAQEMLQVLGIDPSQKKYVAIKSRVHWRADLGKVAREIVECAGVGVCTSDYGQLTFRKYLVRCSRWTWTSNGTIQRDPALPRRRFVRWQIIHDNGVTTCPETDNHPGGGG